MPDPVVTTITVPGAGSWTVPAGVTELTVECWGPGGAGARRSTTGRSAGGGGGSYARSVIEVVPGTDLDYVVGAGGTDGATPAKGADTTATYDGDVVCRGRAGDCASPNATAGVPGAVPQEADGDVRYAGGDGADAQASTYGGGGGGGAGSAGAGGSTTTRYGGDGGDPDGGAGGGGGTTSTAGTAGTAPGGAGGGAAYSGVIRNGGAGAAGQLRITYEVPPPGDPTISEPLSGAGAVPGDNVDLTATATDPGDEDVQYRWWYSFEGGADVLIGTTALVGSGVAETLVWDTDGLYAGEYTLKCKALNEPGAISGFSQVLLSLRYVVIVSPDDESAVIEGSVNLVGKGWLTAPGEVLLQWEVDTNTPPDSGADDYQLLASPWGDQGDEITKAATLTRGTWYFRARTEDEAEATSDWTAIRTLYVLEGLRLLAGSSVQSSILQAANKVFVRVKDSDPLILQSATYDAAEDPLRYSATPRETLIIIPAGDSAAASSVATTQVSNRRRAQRSLSGLKVKLEDGLKLQRGQLVGVLIEGVGLSGTYPIRELVFRVAAGECDVAVGEFRAPRTDSDTLVDLGQRIDRLERETA